METRTNCAARVVIKDEEENFVFLTSDIDQIRRYLPLQYGHSGYLKVGEEFELADSRYRVTGVLFDYYDKMCDNNDRDFEYHVGNHNPYSIDIFVSVKKLND